MKKLKHYQSWDDWGDWQSPVFWMSKSNSIFNSEPSYWVLHCFAWCWVLARTEFENDFEVQKTRNRPVGFERFPPQVPVLSSIRTMLLRQLGSPHCHDPKSWGPAKPSLIYSDGRAKRRCCHLGRGKTANVISVFVQRLIIRNYSQLPDELPFKSPRGNRSFKSPRENFSCERNGEFTHRKFLIRKGNGLFFAIWEC